MSAECCCSDVGANVMGDARTGCNYSVLGIQQQHDGRLQVIIDFTSHENYPVADPVIQT